MDSEYTLIDHEEECVYREIMCPAIECQQKVPYAEIMDHIKNNHPLSLQFGLRQGEYGQKMKMSRYLFDLTNISPKLISIKGLNFVEMWHCKDGTVYVWVYLIGNPMEAARFQYHVYLKKDSGREMVFFGKVKSINEGHETVLDSEDTFSITKPMVKFYSKADSVLEYSFKIRNLKEEVKDDDYESGIDDEWKDFNEDRKEVPSVYILIIQDIIYRRYS